MDSLTALDPCLQEALRDLAPVPATLSALPDAMGAILAEPLIFPHDMPPRPVALRDGFAVASLDLTGASAGVPIPLAAPQRVSSADPLPPGTDAVLPVDGVEAGPAGWAAIRPVNPGQHVRRAGHDGRAGAVMAPAGTPVSERLCLVAAQSGVTEARVRRPRVALDLPDPTQVIFARALVTRLGAQLVDDAPHLIMRTVSDNRPCLALAPGETGWLARVDARLELRLPVRFDGMVAACLALGLPALAALAGAFTRPLVRPLARKLASALGMAELVLLTGQGPDWHPAPAGTLTLAALATADAFAILPPDSEGLAAGTPLAGISLTAPFG